MSNQEVDDFLEHFGVKGMRWGVRNGGSGSTKTESSKKKPSRAEKKAAKKEFYQQKAQRVLAKSLEDPEVLINLKTVDIYPSIVSGKEFVDYVSRGGVFDVKLTDVYAEKSTEGPYVINDRMNERYRG